ncbi:MAG: addiction module protein [Planctomycetes bacterium]|nr:addiction module protein [Planctomycetota bacterium]
MSKLRKQIFEEALKLPPTERAELIENLLTSFEFPSRETIDDLWAQEVESRIEAFERGEISATSAKEVFGKIEKHKE